MATPNTEMERLHLSEDNKEEKEEEQNEEWEPSSTRHASGGSEQEGEAALPQFAEHDDDREAALRSELQAVRGINEVVSGVLDSLQRAKDNMGTVSRTVSSASTLLDTWTRILSQTEHNQRLILNPSWRGPSQDVADMENEALIKQQEAERRELEEQQRKEALARKLEEDERKKTRSSSTARGTRGTSRTRSRISYSAQGSHRTTGSSTKTSTTPSTSIPGSRRPPTSGTRPSGIARGRGRARESGT